MEKISARFIIEILGRPAKHVSEALNTIVIKMGSEKGSKITDKKYHEPKKIKEANDLYTAFAEVEMDFESIHDYFGVLFTYMPSNSEIVSPEKLKTTASELNSLSNSITTRLHNYDSIAKRLISERDMLVNKIKSLGGDLNFGMSSQGVEKNSPQKITEAKKSSSKKSKKPSKKS